MHRFFVNAETIGETQILLSEKDQKHIGVLRLRPTEEVVICDGAGRDYICHIEGGVARILHIVEHQTEANIHCHVYLALSKGERLEWAIQKSVELGAVSVSLFAAKRSIVKYDAKTVEKKIARYTQIAEEAAKQAGRGILPKLFYYQSLQAAAENVPKEDLGLFFHEAEEESGLSQVLTKAGRVQTVHLFTGPEGGFSEEEYATAKQLGLETAHLGRRILRCETAPVVALSALMFWAGEY